LAKVLCFSFRLRRDILLFIECQNRVIINTGILAELYKYGVTGDQLPNLKALADVMNAEYSRNENGAVIKITMAQISEYFDSIQGDDV
jgi:hypothetical protein